MERGIWQVKEQSRCVISDICLAGFTYLHKIIVLRCVYFIVMMLNAVPVEAGILQKNSPNEIGTGCKIDMKKNCRAVFGAYVETSEDADIVNTMADQTHSCLALGPSGNLQGSIKYFDLITGKVIIHQTITVLPILQQF